MRTFGRTGEGNSGIAVPGGKWADSFMHIDAGVYNIIWKES